MNALWTSRSWRFLPLFAICCVLAGSHLSARAIFSPQTTSTANSGQGNVADVPPPANPPDPVQNPSNPGSGGTAGVPPTQASGTPEPGSLVLALTGSGTALLAWLRRRRCSVAVSATV